MVRKLTSVLLGTILFASSGLAFADSDPLMFLPFEEGTPVYCVQGNQGSFSHRGTQEYGFDFTVGPDSFGTEILSPVNGYIREIRSGVPDWTNNNASNADNHYGWGNTVVIQAANTDYYIRIAHLQHGSIPSYLRNGAYVNQGDVIGRMGQTGYSTSPHLHIQVQNAVRGNSIEVDWVEGPIEQGDTTLSQLEPEKYVIDDDRRVNAGAPIRSASNWTNGRRFRSWNWAPEAHGDNYMTSNDSGARYYWGFTPTISGNFDIYANCRGISNRDRNAEYRVYRGGLNIYRVVDQRRMDGETYLGSAYLRSGTRYDARVRQSNGRVCADSIVLYRH